MTNTDKNTPMPQCDKNAVMVSADIKKECELMYSQIKKAENRLKELREICEHEDTDNGSYSYRIGVVQQAEICNSCGIVIRVL
jgi:RecB family exonuclease